MRKALPSKSSWWFKRATNVRASVPSAKLDYWLSLRLASGSLARKRTASNRDIFTSVDSLLKVPFEVEDEASCRLDQCAGWHEARTGLVASQPEREAVQLVLCQVGDFGNRDNRR